MIKIFLSFLLLCSQVFIEAQTCNLDFETSNLSGWTVTKGSPSLSYNYTMTGCCSTPGSTAVTVFSTPFSDPYLGNVPNSPLGGSFVAQVNNLNTNGNASRITNTFAVTSNTVFQFAISGVVDGISESCSSIAYAHVRVLDAGGNAIYSVHHVPNGANTSTCSSSAFTNTINFTAFFCWQTYTVNLAPYIGQNVSVEVTASNCGGWGHFGYCYFDAACVATSPTTVTCSMSTGITEKVDQPSLVIWPNPAKDFLNVFLKPSLSGAELVVYDILGNIVLRQNSLMENQKLSIGNLKAGAYFYRVSKNDEVLTGKFIRE